MDSRGRCTIPARARHKFAWFEPGSAVLGVLKPNGVVLLRDVTDVEPVRSRVEALGRELGGPDQSVVEDQILVLQDRYQRLNVDRTTKRLELPDEVAAHLDVFKGGVMFAARYLDRLELWSKQHREHRLGEEPDILEEMDELPEDDE